MKQSDQRHMSEFQHAAVIDQYVSIRIHQCRTIMGLSLLQLANAIGVTYQQVHKYECGIDRVSTGRLVEIGKALAVEPSWFFDGSPRREKPYVPGLLQRMSLELIHNFMSLKDEGQQVLSQMARLLATQTGAQDAAGVVDASPERPTGLFTSRVTNSNSMTCRSASVRDSWPVCSRR